MKICRIIFLIIASTSIFSCSKDEGKEDNKSIIIDKLKGTYSPTYVSLDGDDITSDFAGFTLTIDESLNFTSNSVSLDRQPNPWAGTGSFTIVEPVSGTTSATFTRNDGVGIFAEWDEASSTVDLSFVFNSSSVGSNGRISAVEGDWVFVFKK